MSGDVREIPRLHSRDLSGQINKDAQFQSALGANHFFMDYEQSGENTETDRKG